MKNISTIFLHASLCLFLTLPLALEAQPRANGEPVKVAGDEIRQYQQPVWSPDGASLAFTSPSYDGIWISDADGGNISELTNEKGAGFGFSWSSDSRTILARVTEREGMRRSHAVKLFDVENPASSRLITEYRPRMASLPEWSEFDDKIMLKQNNSLEVFDSGISVPQMQKSVSPRPVAAASGGRIEVGTVARNDFNEISPFADVTYLNITISPNGEMVAFEVMGGNLFVMNIDGTNVIDLGRAHKPAWSPDSQHLAVQVSEDDGYEYLASDIYAINIDGSDRVNLTAASDLKAMNPSWSPDGARIAFDGYTEGIYLLEIAR